MQIFPPLKRLEGSGLFRLDQQRLQGIGLPKRFGNGVRLVTPEPLPLSSRRLS